LNSKSFQKFFSDDFLSGVFSLPLARANNIINLMNTDFGFFGFLLSLHHYLFNSEKATYQEKHRWNSTDYTLESTKKNIMRNT